MTELNEDWIVKRVHNLKVGDMVSPLRTPRKNGLVVFTPVVGVVTEITKNHVKLEVGGSESPFYVYSDCIFAVDPSWNDGDSSD